MNSKKSTLKIVDTNILVRYIVRDNPKLSNEASKLILSSRLLVFSPVILETMYVLQSVYKFSREELSSFKEFIDHENFVLVEESVINLMFTIFFSSSLSAVDSYLLAASGVHQLPLETQDKKLRNAYNKNSE